MKKFIMSPGLVGLLLLFGACQGQRQAVVTPSPSPIVTAASKSSAIDPWAGRWAGVEGTSLDLAKNGDRWTIRVVDLDGVKTYEGVAAADHLEFKRGDKTETIRPTDGKGTGMKWLVDEKNCLVITVGSEGYCRK